MARRSLLTLLTLALLAGCGGAAEPVKTAATPDPAQDRVAIQKRVAAYVRHMMAGDGRQACAQFTPEYRRDADERAKAGGIGTCAEVISFYGEALEDTMPAGFVEQAADPKRVIVTLRGDHAQAAMRSTDGGPSIKQTTLRRVGSQWLIDGLGVTRPRER